MPRRLFKHKSSHAIGVAPGGNLARCGVAKSGVAPLPVATVLEDVPPLAATPLLEVACETPAGYVCAFLYVRKWATEDRRHEEASFVMSHTERRIRTMGATKLVYGGTVAPCLVRG